MDNRDFLLQTLMETHETVIRINTRDMTMQIISSEDESIPCDVTMGVAESINQLFGQAMIHPNDRDKFDIMLNYESFMERCQGRISGNLFTYRKITDEGLQWVRLYLLIPKAFSISQPDVIIMRRNMSAVESDAEDVLEGANKKYHRIFKCDLKDRTFRMLQEAAGEYVYRNRYWGARHELRGRVFDIESVFQDDVEEYRRETEYDAIVDFFRKGNQEKHFYYRRKIGNVFHWVKLSILPASEYSDEHPVFIYFLEDVDQALISFFSNQGLDFNVSSQSGISNAREEYLNNVWTAIYHFTNRYKFYYVIDLEKDLYINYKMNRNLLQGLMPRVGSYSEQMRKLMVVYPSLAETFSHYMTVELLREKLVERKTIEFESVDSERRPMKVVYTRSGSKDGLPVKAICCAYSTERSTQLKVKTFGTFEVFDQVGNPLRFKKRKSKQLLAYLIDRYGYPVSTADVVMDVLEKPMDDLNAKKYVSTLVKMAIQTLDEAGYHDIIVKEWNSIRVNVEKIDCDYYHLMEGDMSYWRYYHNEYMIEYSWAEVTNAELMNFGETTGRLSG